MREVFRFLNYKIEVDKSSGIIAVYDIGRSAPLVIDRIEYTEYKVGIELAKQSLVSYIELNDPDLYELVLEAIE